MSTTTTTKRAAKNQSDLPVLTDEEQKTLAQIKRWIIDSPETSRVVTITPNIAFILLKEYNRNNRPLKPAKIAEYRVDMSTDEWGTTGDTIKFSDQSKLRDGQNRLTACYQSGCAFETHIVFGIPDHLFDRMDRGKTRDGSDLLAIAGYSNTTQLAVAVRWVHLLESGSVKRRTSLEPRQVLNMLQEKYPTLPDFAQQARRVYDSTRQPIGLVLAMLYLFALKNPHAASDFAAAWAGGKWEGRFKAIGLMQAGLMKLHEASMGRVHDVVRAAFMVKAWNFYAAGRRGTKAEFLWALSDDFPTIEG